MEPKLTVRALEKSYGAVRALDGLSFEARAGEIFGLLGPNGAGKTTAVECILGLREPDAGAIGICGLEMHRQPVEVKQRLGAALQSTALQDQITPCEALRLFGAFYREAAPAGELLERFGLTKKADARFETLSGGQRQRLALALAFVNRPEVLLLDEPTSGLDPQARRELHAAIRQFREEGRTVLLTTHYIEEAHALCDRIAILHRGRIVAMGTPEELIAAAPAGVRLVVHAARPLDLKALGGLTGVTSAIQMEEAVQLSAANVGPVVIQLVNYLERTGNDLLDLQVKKPSLEDVFIELTQS